MYSVARTFVPAAALAATFLLAGVASADKLSDFKTAADKKGCEAIPYSSEQSDCKGSSRTKDAVCKDFSCDLDKVKRNLEKLKEKQKNLEEAKARKNESAARDLERTITDLKKAIDEEKRKARENIEKAKKCIDARVAVQNHFDRVRRLVERERDEALKAYVAKLVDHYKKEGEAHKEPIRQVENAVGKCEKVSSTSY